jgi:glycolate oxidase FAD binding subunit
VISSVAMRPALPADFVARLRGIVGEEFLFPSSQTENEKLFGVAPDLSVSPGDADEVAAVLRVCSEQRIPVVPMGSGLHQDIGLAPQPPFVVLMANRMKEVEHYDPGDLTIGIGAGMTLREVDEIVRPHQQWLPVLGFPQQSALGAATVGGVLAIAAHGPLKHAFGGVREFCIGVRFVTGDGKLGKGGGRVVKNVAGYDLMKLLIGSYGTLGVITSASFKLFPRPRQTVTFVGTFATAQEAIAFRDRVVASPLAPLTLEIVSPGAARLLHGEAAGDDRWRVLVRASGSDRQVVRYRAELGSAVAAESNAEDEVSIWTQIEDFEAKLPASAVVLSVGCAINDVGQVIAAAERIADERGLQLVCIGRAATGSLVIAFCGNGAQAVSAVHSLRAALRAGVIVTARRVPTELRGSVSAWQVASGELEIMRTLKNALDPAWILNRGRYFV